MDDPARARVGAPPDGAVARQSVDWESAEKALSRLQVRIAKTVQERRWGKVRSLQRILTRLGRRRLEIIGSSRLVLVARLRSGQCRRRICP